MTDSSQTAQSRDSAEQADALGEIEWDFAESASSRRSIHSFHSYPARFIPEIPRSFIDALKPPDGTTILDPFCGCGTTLIEALDARHPAVGIDLNPIACLISRVKTATIPDDLIASAQDCIREARDGRTPELPAIPNLDHWFQIEVSESIARLLERISFVDNLVLNDCLRACLSSILVRVSNQDSDTRYAAVSKVVSGELVFKLFEAAAVNLSSLEPCLGGDVRVINKNIFDVATDEIGNNVSLVVTSPPYPNAYEYWLYHKYRMWWLAYDPLRVKDEEIGARAHFFTKRRETEDFDKQMGGVFNLLNKVMIKNGFCCFICGDSKIAGKIVDNRRALLSAASRNGFRLVFQSDRIVKRNRKSFNLHHARTQKEHVLVWQK